MENKLTTMQAIAQAISKPYSGLFHCYQELKTLISESNQRLTKLEREDAELEKTLNRLNENLENYRSMVDDPPTIFKQAMRSQDIRIEKLEKMVEALKRESK